LGPSGVKRKVRLLFVADRIPPELKRDVEFLNKQMSPAEVWPSSAPVHEPFECPRFLPVLATRLYP
jgi:hypothetical protein